MSASGDLIRELLGLGVSRRQIGSSIKRNDSLIGQVERGVKPGRNLEASLEQLRGEVLARNDAGVPLRRGEVIDVAEPAGRLRKLSGGRTAPARVRRPIAVNAGPNHTTSRLGRQAARSGGMGMTDLLRSIGRGDVAWDVSLLKRAPVLREYKRRGDLPAAFRMPGGSVFTLGPYAVVTALRSIDNEHGGSVTRFILAELQAGGWTSDRIAAGDIIGLEMRTWG